MNYFVSYMQWWEAPRPNFPSPIRYTSNSMWVPMNVVIDEHPLKWLEKQNKDIIKLMWWNKIEDTLTSM